MESLKLETELIEKIQDIDIRILGPLQEDYRLSFNNIAEKVGVSVGTAFNHVKSLEKKGIINGYTTILDPSKLGYSLSVIVMIQAEGSHISDVENEICKSGTSVAVYDITGDFGAVAIAKFKDRCGLNAFVKNLLALPYVKITVTYIAFDVIKEARRVKLQYFKQRGSNILLVKERRR